MEAFNEWLEQQSRRGDRVGDLSRDMRIDLTWPTAKVSRRRLHAYLESQGAIQGVFDARSTRRGTSGTPSARPNAEPVQGLIRPGLIPSLN